MATALNNFIKLVKASAQYVLGRYQLASEHVRGSKNGDSKDLVNLLCKSQHSASNLE